MLMGCISLIKLIIYDNSNKAAVMKGETLEKANVKLLMFGDSVSFRLKKGSLPFLHEQNHSQEDDDEEEDPSNDPCDLHRVVCLFLRLH